MAPRGCSVAGACRVIISAALALLVIVHFLAGTPALSDSCPHSAGAAAAPLALGVVYTGTGTDTGEVGSASRALSPARLLQTENATAACGAWLEDKFECTKFGCADKASGYINYLSFLYCDISSLGARVVMMITMLVWMLFLLHLGARRLLGRRRAASRRQLTPTRPATRFPPLSSPFS